MMKKLFFPLFVLGLLGNTALAQEHVKLSNTDLIKLDFEVLSQKKAVFVSDKSKYKDSYKQLIKNAELLLNYKPVSVMQKTEFPPSGNKHDYMSIGPYWWPNPAKPNGLPYIRKDGEVNPEVKSYPDKENMPKLCENVYNLALAYYFSNDERYAKHASKLLQVWFLDEDTKMNPNLKYGQAIKGVNEGRAEGIIDTRQFIFAIDAIELLKSSSHWTTKNQIEMKKWFSEFLNWLNSSEIGKDEMYAKNNHGVWFDAQALSIALYVENKDMANKIVARAASRLDVQMDANGFFPLEMERTTSLHYSVFILNAFNIIAQLSQQTDVNFYTLQTKSGKSLLKGFEAIFPYISNQQKWMGKQIKEFSFSDAYPLLVRSSTKYNCKTCLDAIRNTTGDQYPSLLLNLL